MKDSVLYFFEYVIFFYVTFMVVATFCLAVLAHINARRYRRRFTKKEDLILKDSPFAPGISVIAPAYNEEKSIIINVRSMMTLDYPNYDVIIVNDGSTDKTLELLIEEFQLVETPYAYIEKIKTKPFRRILRSINPEYRKLTIVDKDNGGTKADATNAGINVSGQPYFLCTDVDCILSRDALTKMIQPVLNSTEHVIAVGATMRMANRCEVDENGAISRVRPPKRLIPCFQEIEYLRSYLISKMGWAVVNAVPNVSGGLGLFDKSVVVEIGGYDPISHAEDMDLTLRMVAYMKDFDQKYRIAQIPVTTCWTEGPPNISVLNRQRTRWGRGLMQIFIVHRKMLFNRKYGKVGLLLLPFIFLCEFLAPVFEALGILATLFLAVSGQLNYETVGIMLAYVYLFGITISSVSVMTDIWIKKQYNNFREYIKLFILPFVEIILYHPLTVFFSCKGYIDFLSKQSFEWGAMKRQGFEKGPETVKSTSRPTVVS